MKRAPQLIPLSQDHHRSLVLANRSIRAATSQNISEISTLCDQLNNEIELWANHFEIEETSLFPLLASYPELRNLIAQLEEEHQTLLTIGREIHRMPNEQKSLALHRFGTLLKSHTRSEERQLFPAAEALLSQTQLDDLAAKGNAHQQCTIKR